jgi:hypothetical protein
MIRLAKRLNRHGERAVYVENRTDDLSVLQTGTVDFLYSDVVLQHIEPRLATQYVAEFLRILRVGGVAVFQMASHPRPEVASVVQPSTMSDDAYKVRFEVSDPPTTLTPGASATLSLLVTNTSGKRGPRQSGRSASAITGSMARPAQCSSRMTGGLCFRRNSRLEVLDA